MNRSGALLFPLLLLNGSCVTGTGAEEVDAKHLEEDLINRTEHLVPDGRWEGFDITQRTCALFVAIRSHALDERISFGRDLDDAQVHWNMCPGGNMVACATVPGANGEPVVTGIPWPYGPVGR